MLDYEYLSEVIRLEYLQSLQQNFGKSIENLQKEEDIMITFSDLNVWFLNKDSSDLCIEDVKSIFYSLESNKLGKVSLRNFMRAYSSKLMLSVQNIINQQAKSQSYENIITNAQFIQQFLIQSSNNNNNNKNDHNIQINNNDDHSTSSHSPSSPSSQNSNFSNSSINLNLQNNLQKHEIFEEEKSKPQKETRNKLSLQLNIKEITDIDLKPSFSKLNLEGYQLEIGDEKKVQQLSSIRSLEGISIQWNEEKINIIIRPKKQTVFIRLYEILSDSRNLVAEIIFDPFSLLCPQSFNKNVNFRNNNNSFSNSLSHSIPLLSTQTGKDTYCNLQISSAIQPAEKNINKQNELQELRMNSIAKNHSFEYLLNSLDQRIIYMNQKLQQNACKYARMINQIQAFVKPFQSIKLDDNYLKYLI